MNYPPRIRIAVPSGVGDCYWVLTKLGSFRKKHNIEHLTLCVQKSKFTRALDWSQMTPLVDATEEFAFQPDGLMQLHGFTTLIKGVHCGMWPNHVLERGSHLSQWLPHYELDLNFAIKTSLNYPAPGIVVYISSVNVNREWFPNGGPTFWSNLLRIIWEKKQVAPVVIGSNWDREFYEKVGAKTPHVCYLGKTSLPEVAAILKNADLVIGMISGMTILANHFQTPCVAISPPRFSAGFHGAWIKPNTPYAVLKSSEIQNPESVFNRAISFKTDEINDTVL